jgi:hypothetical protein
MHAASLARRPLLIIIVLFLCTRAALVGFGTWANVALPANEGDEFKHLLDGGPALDMWYRWDAGFYATIATEGYRWFNNRAPDGDMAFLPLYPAAVRAVMAASGCGFSPYLSTCATVAGLIVSNIALLAACIILYRLALPGAGTPAALAAVALLLIAPGTIFFSGVYTEALFLLLALLTFYALDRDSFAWAVTFACLAALTRSVGIALVPALLWVAWARSASAPGARARRFLTTWQTYAALLPALVFGAYVLVAGVLTGNPLAYFSSYEIVWERSLGSAPWDVLLAYFSGQPVSLWGYDPSWIDLAAFSGGITLALLVLRENRAWGIFALGALALPFLSGTLIGMPRFAGVIFPFYILIGAWAARAAWRLAAASIASAALAALFITRFVTWRWIA